MNLLSGYGSDASSASTKRVVRRAQLPGHAALLAAASSLQHSARADDDGPATKRAKGDSASRSKLMDFLPAPRHAVQDSGPGSAGGLGSGVGGGGSRRPLDFGSQPGSSSDPASSSAGVRPAGSSAGGSSSRGGPGSAAAPLPAGFFEPAAMTGGNEMYRTADDDPEQGTLAGHSSLHHPSHSAAAEDGDVVEAGTETGGLHGGSGVGSGQAYARSAMHAAAGSRWAGGSASASHHAGFEYHAQSQPAQASLGAGGSQHQQGRQQQQRQQFHDGGGSGGGSSGGAPARQAPEEMSADAMFEEAVRLETEKAVKRGHGKTIAPDIKFIEINQGQLTYMDPAARSAAEGTKTAIGPEYAAKQRAAAKAFEGDKLAKRKHQIGTLFHHSKMAELDNMEKRGHGTKTKGETQAKYGW
ncbi:MAG: hypothetical protein WDW36_002773 [Sanguina aurantia]